MFDKLPGGVPGVVRVALSGDTDILRITKCRAMAIVPSNYILLSILQLVVRNMG